MDVLLDTLRKKIDALRALGDRVPEEIEGFEAEPDLPPEGKAAHIREARRKGEADLRALLRDIDTLLDQVSESVAAHRRSDVGTQEARSQVLQILQADRNRFGDLIRSGDRYVLQALRHAVRLLGMESDETHRAIDEALVEIGAADPAAEKALALDGLREEAETTGRFALSRLEGRPSAPERRLAMAHAKTEAE